MEENITQDLMSKMEEVFSMEAMDAEDYKSLDLAYIGDCIYDLVIRTLVMSKGNRPVKDLHQATRTYVCASAQSKMMREIQGCLNEDERSVYKRGRNTKSVSAAKNQSVTDYRRATGFEALMGYLYLKKDYDRMLYLIRIGLESLSAWEEES